MAEKAGEYIVLRQTLDGIMGGSTPAMESAKGPPPTIYINGGTVIIGDGKHIHPPAEKASCVNSINPNGPP